MPERIDPSELTAVALALMASTKFPMLASCWSRSETRFPMLRSYLGSIDNPKLIIYRVTPDWVCFMREWALEYVEVRMG